MFARIAEDDWRTAHDASSECEYIRQKAFSLASHVKLLFESSESLRSNGLSLGEPDEAGRVNIVTPFGNARLRLVMHSGKNGVGGRYLVERELFREDDVRYWEAVWAMGIAPQKSSHYPYFYGDNPTDSFGVSGIRSDNVLFECGMSIIYAVGRASAQ